MKKLQRGQGPVHDHDFRISREITTFGYQRPLAHAKWTFQKHFRCADAHCGSLRGLRPKGGGVGRYAHNVRTCIFRKCVIVHFGTLSLEDEWTFVSLSLL